MEARKSDTPRTDRFVQRELKPVRLRREEFVQDGDFMRVVAEVRDLMVAYAEHARTLEREVNASVPREWRGVTQDEAMAQWIAVHQTPMTAHEKALFHFAFDMGGGER
jgi:hypothetical protein